MKPGPIGIFDSGFGGLTVLKEIIKELPKHNYLYFGDNARTPYGTRSFKTIYDYTYECVKYLFDQGCPLVVLACNTASSKALRNIQQKNLPLEYPDRRVLGVIRPTAEYIGKETKTGKVGVLGTVGTINSESYLIEIKKQYPTLKIFQQACPLWVPLVESGEHNNAGADYFVKKYLDQVYDQDEEIDTLLLACTHYPILLDKIKKYAHPDTNIINQGKIVAPSLKNYLERHPEVDSKCIKNGEINFLTTDDAENFNRQAKIFFEQEVFSKFVHL